MDSGTIEIHIEQLGPIRDSQIVLKPFMFFSGESGTGKSYTALLVHYIYCLLCNTALSDFFKELGVSYNQLMAEHPDDEAGVLYEFSLGQLETWCSKAAVSYLGQMLGNPDLKAHISIRFKGVPDHYKYTFKKEVLNLSGDVMDYFDLIQLNNRFSVRVPHRSEKWEAIPLYLLFQMSMKTIFGIKQSKTFLLPPSRGALVGLSDTTRWGVMASMGMYEEFLSDFSDLKAKKIDNADTRQQYKELSEKMLQGNIQIRENDLFYEQPGMEAPIPIMAAASSVKELTPFALMLQKEIVADYAILFEEPESHLHPEMQIQVADLLAYILNEGGRLQVTTHSDYFLRRINDLIRLHLLKKKMSEEAYTDFCQQHKLNPDITIPAEKVGAYYFQRQDTVVKILPQSAEEGIPFDTFSKVLKNEVAASSFVYDKLNELE